MNTNLSKFDLIKIISSSFLYFVTDFMSKFLAISLNPDKFIPSRSSIFILSIKKNPPYFIGKLKRHVKFEKYNKPNNIITYKFGQQKLLP